MPGNVGYTLLFLLVGAESAGAPGETSLIVAGAVAAQGRLSLPLVIAVAATAAILGDNTGYLIGRRGLRLLLERPGRWSARRRRLVARCEAFFARRGSAAVFFGRWLPGLRVVASWLAGANRMRWRCFLLWNGLGGIACACSQLVRPGKPQVDRLRRCVISPKSGQIAGAIAGHRRQGHDQDVVTRPTRNIEMVLHPTIHRDRPPAAQGPPGGGRASADAKAFDGAGATLTSRRQRRRSGASRPAFKPEIARHSDVEVGLEVYGHVNRG